jgi:hypothetical protein
MNIKSIARVAAVFAVMTSGVAFADTIVWKDPVEGFTMSYPDSWTVQTDDVANTRLRVAGPLGEDLATCRMKVADDGRAKIYPKDLVDEAVSEKLTRDFWTGEVSQYEKAKITDFYDPASLGNKGDATAVRVSFFVDGPDDKKIPMYGIMIGSLYGDKLYLASCSSRHEVYDRWSPVFMSILDSVELDSRYHPFATGYYRDFLSDPKLYLPRTKPGTVKESNHLSFWQWIFTDKYHR